MNRIIYILALTVTVLCSCNGKKEQKKSEELAQLIENLPDSVYLMSYFKAPAQHLFYAYSTDGLNWVDINKSNPIFYAFDDNVAIRDPYMKRITHNGKTKFHLIHTWGWSHPAIFHWESDDLITWTATNGGAATDDGKIFVMDGENGNLSSDNAWAPEFTYDANDGIFYVYWASDYRDGYFRHHYTTTKDWLTFTPSKVYFDPGFSTIDMTILPYGDTYYAFYKDERNGEKKIRLATSKSLNPEVEKFEGINELFPGYSIEVEGPEVFKAIGENKWYLYWDRFVGDKGVSFASATADNLEKWDLISDENVTNPSEVKHGSVEIISKDELSKILHHFNVEEFIVLPTADVELQEWKYTTVEPSDNWMSQSFDDSTWSSGKGGFGANYSEKAIVSTPWNLSDIWIRKAFVLKDISDLELEYLSVRLAHDDEAQVYINGVLAVEANGYTSGYKVKSISEEARKAIVRNGENIIAIYCRQDTGGQYIDAGLIAIVPVSKLK